MAADWPDVDGGAVLVIQKPGVYLKLHDLKKNKHQKVRAKSVFLPVLSIDPETLSHTRQERGSESMLLGHLAAKMQPNPPSLLFPKVSKLHRIGNLTRVSEFFLLGLSDDPELQPVLFILFLSMYLVTVLGNLLIILAVTSDPHLHTPMYFFLSSLSLADIAFISTTVPRFIVDIQTHSRVISYEACLTQMSFFILFGGMDDMLLTVMAYDRFIAICHPLHYQVIMNPRLCCFFISMSFFVSLFDSQVQNLIVSQFTCFKDVDISNFFCDPSLLLNLSCSETFTNDIVMYIFFAIFGFLPFLVIFFSYYKILSSILRVPSSSGMYKAFSTCGSHLSVVCLFYGTALSAYLSSTVSQSPRKDVVASVMYTVVTPMLNPFIYSLRNRDIKRATWRFPSKKKKISY
ncbi:LOW QUALITY PROTEIN: olfactory receptor 18-like [Hippopotamus amphibius kiboko]|uniref:LOW QUALITY PROTEIN: olfactory receptor 18-like n=1 Tax=Hippopotamus amphibius kiboko TaxID=575201 RepID=UPI002593644A|nr:LOW QUALITY PROTEIN: olfactory receptor 18-like [Hippopotamus amphibius kiboko]